MPNFINLVGNTYGELRVIAFAGNDAKSRTRPTGFPSWRCKCSCGKQCVVLGLNLRNGRTKSCGHTMTTWKNKPKGMTVGQQKAWRAKQRREREHAAR